MSKNVVDHTGYPYTLVYDNAEFQEGYMDEDGRWNTRVVPCVVLRNGEGYDITTVITKAEFEKRYFCDGCQKEVSLFEIVS